MSVSASFRIESQNQTASAGGAITVVAPAVLLVVARDTTSTTDVGDLGFINIGHRINYGGAMPGEWSYPSLHAASTRQKNEWLGHGVAACLCETPGTFTFRHKAKDSAGDEDESLSITVTVQDPEIVYDPSQLFKTFYISTGSLTAGQDGIPANAVNILENQTSWPLFRSNATDTRYLLKAGDNFLAFGEIEFRMMDGWQLGRFGTGTDPRVGATHVGTVNPNSHGVSWPTTGTIYDIHCNSYTRRTVTKFQSFIRGTSETQIDNSSGLDWHYQNGNATTQAAYEWPQVNAIIDTVIMESGAGINNTYQGSGRGQIVMGCDVGSPTAGEEHTIRDFQSYESVFSHNRVAMPAANNRLCFRMHSAGSMPYNNQYNLSNESESAYTVVERNEINYLSMPDQIWPVEFCPQNSGADPQEGIRDGTFFNNDLTVPGSINDIRLAGMRLAEGQNTIAGVATTLSAYTSHQIAGAPPGWDGTYHLDQVLPTPSAFGADITPPTATLSAPSGTQAETFTIGILFNEDVTLDAPTYTLTNCTASNLTGTGSSWTMDITPVADTLDNLSVTIDAGSFVDAALNESLASNTIVVAFDTRIDVTPDQLIYSPATDQALSTLNVESGGEQVAGVAAGNDIAISIVDGQYSVSTDSTDGIDGTWGAFTVAASSVQLGYWVKLRTDAAATYSTNSIATLTVGGVVSTFTVATISNPGQQQYLEAGFAVMAITSPTTNPISNPII